MSCYDGAIKKIIVAFTVSTLTQDVVLTLVFFDVRWTPKQRCLLTTGKDQSDDGGVSEIREIKSEPLYIVLR